MPTAPTTRASCRVTANPATIAARPASTKTSTASAAMIAWGSGPTQTSRQPPSSPEVGSVARSVYRNASETAATPSPRAAHGHAASGPMCRGFGEAGSASRRVSARARSRIAVTRASATAKVRTQRVSASRSLQSSKAFPQALAPVREAGRACALAAQHRVRRPRCPAPELVAGDPEHPGAKACLLEDRLRELRPAAFPGGGEVPDPVRTVEELPRHRGEMADVRWTADLVVDNTHFVLLRRERQHRPHEVPARPAEEPRAPHDPALADLPLAFELRAAVDRERGRLVRLDIRAGLLPVEDVVGRVVDDGRTERGDVAGSADVHGLRCGLVVLGAVHVRPRCRVQDELRPEVDRRRRDVEGLARPRVRLREDLEPRLAELAAGAGDQDAAIRSRSDRIGDCVLQRCLTRGSSQGTPCSSGSAGSYSSVTW